MVPAAWLELHLCGNVIQNAAWQAVSKKGPHVVWRLHDAQREMATVALRDMFQENAQQFGVGGEQDVEAAKPSSDRGRREATCSIFMFFSHYRSRNDCFKEGMRKSRNYLGRC